MLLPGVGPLQAYASRIRTCRDLCRDVSGVPLELLPMTQDKVILVCARLKEAEYKSADRYLGAYKLLHDLERPDLPFNKAMSMFYGRALRSLRLGVGTKRRAATFDVRAVARVASSVKALCSLQPCTTRGPIAPLTSLVAATCFALREIESSSLALKHVHLNYKLRIVEVTFLDSQTSLFLLSGGSARHGCANRARKRQRRGRRALRRSCR